MASFFRRIDIFKRWNNRIHPELNNARNRKDEIRDFPENGPAELIALDTPARTNVQTRGDIGFMAGTIHELLELLRDTPTVLCADDIYDRLRTNYYDLCDQIVRDEREEMLRQPRL